MATQVATDQVTLTVDGQSVTVPKGTLILDAAKKVGIDIPIFCSHPKMAPVAVCRMCLVEVEKMPKLQPACAVYVTDGMVVRTKTEQVDKHQKGVLEFLLINHPLDCPICDKGGECPLQDQTYQYGPGASRYDFQKAHFDKAVPLSDTIVLDRERCILCWRCTRFSEEISGERELALIERGAHTIIGTFNDQPAKSKFQGNWTEICPVGALTSRQYRFVSRPWDLDRTASVCPGCSMGCNIQIDARHNRIGRFQSRENLAVDDGWLCDYGRYSFPHFQRTWQDAPRLRRDGQLAEVGYDEAIRAAADALKGAGSAVAGWASPSATNEEFFLFQRLFREVLKSSNLDHRYGSTLDPMTDDMTLPIADIERCDNILVVGGQKVIDAAPVLHLRLFKAKRNGVKVLMVEADRIQDAVDAVPGDAKAVGLITTEGLRKQTSDIQTRIQAKLSGSVRRLVVTHGPNSRGAKDHGILPNFGPNYVRLDGRSGKGRRDWPNAGIKVLYIHEPSPLYAFDPNDEEMDWLRGIQTVIYHRFKPSTLDRVAHVVIPGHGFPEKDGTVTNMEGRVQLLDEGIDAPGIWQDWRVFQEIANALGGRWDYDVLDKVAADQRKALPKYSDTRAGSIVLWGEQE